MSFYRRIKYFLVHTLMLSNKAAAELIEKGLVEIDSLQIFENVFLEDHSEIKVNGKIERLKKEFVYLKFHKPTGYESTLNKNISENLSTFFPNNPDLAIAGRLDKQSEGLMLLSNDGKWVEKMCNPKFEKEKEYLVRLNRTPTEDFFTSFQNGVQLGDYLTAPCYCVRMDDNQIKIILKEGKNRQIRRMCKTLGFTVTELKRIRVDSYELNDLGSGEQKLFSLS
ncbi:hypothetical protein CNR22_20660 [Sphingobacteriaceae bacterium]|nr:hypothetical protein CNR22_20660 [Sphingobacteriaceae bacterium]